LIALAPIFYQHLAPQGTLVLSGILRAQLPDLQAAYAPFFTDFQAVFKEDWVCLSATRCSTLTANL
jgi:ribosomal protein L11 methylase PrmA